MKDKYIYRSKISGAKFGQAVFNGSNRLTLSPHRMPQCGSFIESVIPGGNEFSKSNGKHINGIESFGDMPNTDFISSRAS